MRVIRPEALLVEQRRRPRRVAAAMIAVGVVSLVLAFIGPPSPIRIALLTVTGAIGIGIGAR